MLSDSLRADLEDAAMMVDCVDWSSLQAHGYCIPVSYALSEFMALRKRPARVAETRLTAHDPFNVQWMEIQPYEHGFLGHAVVLLPGPGILMDGSLWSQQSKVLANVDVPPLVVCQWQRKTGIALGRIGRVELTYEPDLKAKTWKTRSWPWEALRNMVVKFDQELTNL